MQALYSEKSKGLSLSDLGTRLIALLIDVLLLFLILVIIEYYTISSDETALLLKPERLLDVLIGWVYFAGTESCAGQATLGKHLLGLQVTSHSGKRLSFYNASIRYFTKPLSLLVLLVRGITGASLPYRRLPHDKLAHAQVTLR
ncbi:RDD family protein [Pontibacter chitinilyticus]|uniref:RDD family protein n=1 Tax=Pontibacter chitinilyticus TaxID=2674989 RepID=UPI0032197A51